MKKQHRYLLFLAWAICAALVTYGSVSPNVSVPEKYHLDKLIHGGAYAGLAFLSSFFINNRKAQFAFLLLLVAIGGGIEIIQTLIPPRDGTWGDFAADSIGVFAGYFIAVKLRPIILKFFK